MELQFKIPTTPRAAGLDHAYSCPDIMTYLDTCGPGDDKTFTKAHVSCGESSARPCMCAANQNSYVQLANKLGATCQ